MTDETPTVDLTVGPPGEPEVDELAGELLDDELAAEATLAVEPTYVDPATVRVVLETTTGVIHALAADPDVPDHWHATDDELEQASAALARIANRSPVLRRAVGGGNGDAIALVIPVGKYAIRNAVAGRQAARQREETHRGDEQPEADDPGAQATGRWPGVAADPGAHGTWPRPRGDGAPGGAADR